TLRDLGDAEPGVAPLHRPPPPPRKAVFRTTATAPPRRMSTSDDTRWLIRFTVIAFVIGGIAILLPSLLFSPRRAICLPSARPARNPHFFGWSVRGPLPMAPIQRMRASSLGSPPMNDVIELSLLVPANKMEALMVLSQQRRETVGQILRQLID